MKGLGILVCVLFAAAAAAQPMVIDGEFDSGEWAGASIYGFTVNLLDGTTTDGKLYIKNDADNLYVCMRVAEPAMQVGASFYIEIDSPGTDGAIGDDDDVLVLTASASACEPKRFADVIRFDEPPCPPGAVCSAEDIDAGGTRDGNGAAGNDGSWSTFEMWHPLASADTANDMQLPVKSSMGFRASMWFADGGGTVVNTFYPSSGLETYNVSP